jgi:hypothetical protein
MRSVATTLLMIAAAAGGHASTDRETPAEVWPQFRGNHRLNGVSTSSLPAQLTLQWTYEAGEPIESSAAIANGTRMKPAWATEE